MTEILKKWGYKVPLRDGDFSVVTINGREVYQGKITVTPEEAKEIIEQSDKIFHNRRSSQRTVNAYKTDIDNNRWKVNGESLKFREDGALVDGRHRLLAVAQGDKPMEFLFVANLEKGVEDTLDIGMLRSLESAFAFHGIDYEKGAGAVIKYKLTLDKGVRFQHTSTTASGFTRQELVQEFLDNVDEYNHATAYAADINKQSRHTLTKTEVGSLYVYLTKTMGIDPSVVEKFFLNLVSTPRNSNNIYARAMERFDDRKVYKTGRTPRLNEFIRCWNSYVAGKISHNVHMSEDEWFRLPNKKVHAIGTIRHNVSKANELQK